MELHDAMQKIPTLFFFNDTATTEIYTLSLHDALPISRFEAQLALQIGAGGPVALHTVPEQEQVRSEEHTSELQSPCNLVCRLLLEKKNDSGVGLDVENPALRFVFAPTLVG